MEKTKKEDLNILMYGPICEVGTRKEIKAKFKGCLKYLDNAIKLLKKEDKTRSFYCRVCLELFDATDFLNDEKLLEKLKAITKPKKAVIVPFSMIIKSEY
jgi:hypothetical protein